MDTNNHNVLQFVSAAAQVFESQEGASLLGTEKYKDKINASDELQSEEYFLNNNAWDIADADEETALRTSGIMFEKPEHIRELLAEATGLEMMERPTKTSDDKEQLPSTTTTTTTTTTDAMTSIDDRLRAVFKLSSHEKLIKEWPCYIVQSAIVPGIMYLTNNHVCFYASLPKNQVGFHKNGYLLLKKSNGNYERYYFELKEEDVLAWFESSADSYSPLGKIDLKHVLTVRKSSKKKHGIRIVTMNKTWHLQADTNAAVVEWTNTLQKAIFRAKNNGTSLKITLPFGNILDIEQTEAFEFQKFLKIRAVGIDDSFVVDEYYFAYFSDIQSTFDALETAWEKHPSTTTTTKPSTNNDNDDDDDQKKQQSPLEDLESPSLSISDLYDTSSRPITIQSTNKKDVDAPQPPTRMNSVVANALAVPGAIKDLLYPSNSTSSSNKSIKKQQQQQQQHREENSSSSDDEDDNRSWLSGKSRSGMKLVYGLLGGGGSGSTATELTQHQQQQQYYDHHDGDDDDDHGYGAYDDDDEDEDDEEDYRMQSSPRADEAEVLDERTITNFSKYFVLPSTEQLLVVYRCSLMKTLPCYGKLYISNNYISFNSRGVAAKAKMIIPFSEVLRIQKIRSRGYIFHSLSIVTQTKKEIFLEFSSINRRNSCFARLFIQHKRVIESADKQQADFLNDWETRLMEEELKERHVVPTKNNSGLPVISRISNEAIVYKKPEKPLHFTCITIGTRGDVQPYIALCKGLMKEGHTCRIATHDEFKDWIEEHGIEFRTVGGDPGELMRICVENNFFSVNFVVEGLRLFKDWIDELLTLSWKAVQGTDIILESPSAMIGVHMAEALRVPYFRSFPMPMTRTRSFPHPFATPNNPKGRLYNDMTYVLFDHAVWRAIAARTNAFRKKELHLPPTSYEKLQIWKIPYLYSFSPSIVPSPLDWLDWIHCTGYWFLDNPQTGWSPDTELKEFIEAADSRPIVYIGFGSIIVSDPLEITRIIVSSVLLSNVRAIVSRGWSSRLHQGSGKEEEMMLRKHPGTILSVQSVPHDWLFPKIRAVVHHGGAGTTAAGLRAGRPTIIKPFFADQFFWGERVEEMGLGRCIKQLSVEQLSAALRVVSTDENMLKMANRMGEKIRAETGVETAIQCIYRDMELAKARTLSSAQKTAAEYGGESGDPQLQQQQQSHVMMEDDQEWTLIDDTTSGSISPESWKPKES